MSDKVTPVCSTVKQLLRIYQCQVFFFGVMLWLNFHIAQLQLKRLSISHTRRHSGFTPLVFWRSHVRLCGRYHCQHLQLCSCFWPKYLIYSHSLWHTENVSVWTGHFAWTLTPRITSFRALFADSEVALWKISAAYLYGLTQKHVAASDWKSGCCYCTSPWPVPWGERRDKQLNKCCVSSVSLLALQWKKLGLGDTNQNDYLCVFKLNGDNTKYI